MESTSYTAEKALAEALARLEKMETEKEHLKSKLQRMARDARALEGRLEDGGGGREGNRSEAEKLLKQNKELMHVNGQWDLEYKELNEAFRRYRIDSKQAEGEHQSEITHLREAKEAMSAEIRELRGGINHRDREIVDLRAKVRVLEDEIRASRLGRPVVSQERVRELEEESHMLRQQLKAYQDDFNAERRDRERMNEEKESASIRYEAEVTSLKLQLERCRNELAHYTAEANRLSQQLRLKSQMEEEQYKRHLESNGYITRSASGHLPPLDPFVDMDDETRAPSPRPKNPSPRLLTRGVDLVQAYSNSHGAQAYPGPLRAGAELMDSERSRSPIKNGTGQGYPGTSPHIQHTVSPIMVPPAPTNADHPNGRVAGQFRPNIPPSMTNGSSHYPPQRHNGYSHSNGNTAGNRVDNSYHVVELDDVNLPRPVYQDTEIGRSNAPPLETKGKYSCPRCERKFENKRIWTDHKSRCVV